MQLVCDAEIRLVEHEAAERDVAGRAELAGEADVVGQAQPGGQFALERLFRRTGFRARQDPDAAGRAFRPATAGMRDREMCAASGLQNGLACNAVDRDVVGQRSRL